MTMSKSVGALSTEQDRAASFSTWIGERLTTVTIPLSSAQDILSPLLQPVPHDHATKLPSQSQTNPQRQYLQASAQAAAADNLDYLDVRLSGVPQRALLDSGASVCFIDSALVDKCGLRTVPVPKIHIALGDDSTVSVDRAVLTELRFAHGLRYNAQLFVMDLGPAPIILGQTFIKELAVQVDHGPAKTVTCPATAHRPAAILPIMPPPEHKAPAVHLACLSERQMARELHRAARAGQTTVLAHICLRVRQHQLN